MSAEPPPKDNTTATATMSNDIITLDVNGTFFRVNPMTLSASPFFDALITRWTDNLRPNKSYYIDADPTLFPYLLTYMRRPSRFPLFWSDSAGFDYPLYNALEAEADYFGLHSLSSWIREQKFLGAIKTGASARLVSSDDLAEDIITEGTDVKIWGSAIEGTGKRKVLMGCAPHAAGGWMRGCRDCEEVVKIGGEEGRKVLLVSMRTIVDLSVCENGPS